MLLLLTSLSAAAVDFDHYALGAFYPIDDVDLAGVDAVAEAVVSFGNATGFIVSADGLLLTNHHVYKSFGDTGVVYRRHDGQSAPERLKVSLVSAHASHDVALYQVESPHPLPWLPLRARPPEIGEDVWVIGHPDSDPLRVSLGTVLARDLRIGGRPSVEYSAQTWWGSSGSPVLDAAGQVVALHWGWDSRGTSHGRLTGVPIHEITREVPILAELASASGLHCDFSVRSTLLQANVRPDHERRYDRVRLDLSHHEPRCFEALEAVTWTLHPSFDRPVVDGDASANGSVLLTTWGSFPTVARVTIGGTTREVRGRVSWR